METIIMTAKGGNGTVELFENKVRLKRGWLMRQSIPEKEILIDQISAIQFKEPGFSGQGYIQFSFLGGAELKGSGFFKVAKDENTVTFGSGDTKAFLAIKEAIEQRVIAARSGRNSASNLDEIQKLVSLRTKGIISEEEFNAKKKQLLGL